jgi:hypothetical protein
VSLIGSPEHGHLKLKISNSITNEFYDFDVTLAGNTFGATVTPAKSAELKSVIAPELDHNQNYTTYILIGLGTVAIGLATAGGR